jgi:hypothetical protein
LPKKEDHNFIIRFFIFFGVFHPFVLACTSTDTDPCASYLNGIIFSCGTFLRDMYKKTSNSATTGLPAYATFCSNKSSKISSACSYLIVGASTAKMTAKTRLHL